MTLPALTLQLHPNNPNRESNKFRKWMLIKQKFEFWAISNMHGQVLHWIVLHVLPVARQVLPHLSSLLSSESTDTGISDDIVATACSTARRLVLADNELNKKVISTDLVNFLMDLSSNEWVFIYSSLQWPAAVHCLTPLCCVIGHFPKLAKKPRCCCTACGMRRIYKALWKR